MDIGKNIRTARTQRGLSLEVMAGLAGWSKSALHHAETDYEWGQLDRLRAVARVLQLPLDALIEGGHKLQEALTRLPASDTGLNLPWSPAGSLAAVTTITLEGETCMTEQHPGEGFRPLSGSALTSTAERWLAAQRQSPEDVVSAAGGQVPEEVVDRLDQMVANLRTLDERLSRRDVMGLTIMHATSVQTLLAERAYTNSVGRRLYALEAELLRLCGRLAYESGQHARAQRYWLVALRAATTAGDEAQQANVVAFMADQAYDLGHMRDAATLAVAARDGYRGITPEVVARLAIQAALAHAAVGERQEYERAMGEAMDTMPNLGHQAAPGWSHWVDGAMVIQFAASGASHLADWDTAVMRYEQAASMQGSWAASAPHELGRIKVQTGRAVLRSVDADAERAFALGEEALSLFEGSGGAPPMPVIQAATGLVNDLQTRWQDPRATELAHRTRELAQHAA